MTLRHRLLIVALSVFPLCAAAQAANDFPTRPIRLIVGFAPGGATDVVARLLSVALSQELKQTVYIENLPGASGLLAWKTVANSQPDGYTLMMAENAISIRPSLPEAVTAPFDPTTQLAGVALAAHSPLALVVAKRVQANTAEELIKLSKATPKKLDYASAGSGSVAQMVWDVVKQGAQIDAVDVPFRGGGPAIAAIIANQTDIIMASTQVTKPLVEQQSVKALAVTGKERSPALPDVPTLSEVGIKHADAELEFWFGIFGPKALPETVKERLEKAVKEVVADPEIKAKLLALDISPQYMSGSDLDVKLKTEIANWKAFTASKTSTAP
jgi:tripartite-type tricarboxylate transporter receptor subunit TctC